MKFWYFARHCWEGIQQGFCDSFVIDSEFSEEWKFAFCDVVKVEMVWDVRPCWRGNSRPCLRRLKWLYFLGLALLDTAQHVRTLNLHHCHWGPRMWHSVFLMTLLRCKLSVNWCVCVCVCVCVCARVCARRRVPACMCDRQTDRKFCFVCAFPLWKFLYLIA
jgi:hypothetical protein